MAPRSPDGDLDDEEDGEVDEVDSPGGSPAKISLGDRIRSGLQPNGNGRSGLTGRSTTPPSDPQSTKQIVERLDDRERMLCFAASALAVVAGIAIYFVEHENKHFHQVKGQLSPASTLVLGFVVGALLLGATLLGRRAPVGFVALFGFLFFSATQFLAGVPFLVLAVWLLVRSYKFQKEAAATRKAAMAEGRSSSPSGARGRRGPARATASTRSGTAKSSSKGPTPAEANKRYTPKRPAPPPPKPSRRDRKAASASD